MNRTPDPREDPADRPGLLARQDAAERHRDGSVHRAGARPRAVRRHRRPARPASALGARLPRHAGRARASCSAPATATPTRRRPICSSTGSKPSYVGGILEMANHRLYPFWGHLTEALRTGQPQNEVKGGGPGLFETLYADPARLQQFLAAMTGISHGANLAIARAGSLEELQDLRRRRHGAGRPGRADCPGQPAPARARASTCRRSRRSSRRTWRRSASRTGCRSSPGSFFTDDLPKADVVLMGHILHDWDLPTKRMLIDEGLRRAAGRRRADRLRGDHRRRSVEERVRADDEPQHADRDAGRLRLHRRRLRGWMQEAGFSSTRVEHLVGPDSMVVGVK